MGVQWLFCPPIIEVHFLLKAQTLSQKLCGSFRWADIFPNWLISLKSVMCEVTNSSRGQMQQIKYLLFLYLICKCWIILADIKSTSAVSGETDALLIWNHIKRDKEWGKSLYAAWRKINKTFSDKTRLKLPNNRCQVSNHYAWNYTNTFTTSGCL